MTYGEVRFRLSKLSGGIDLDLLDGWIQDRYQAILDKLEWDRLTVTSTLQTEAEYSSGTVEAIQGNSAITGDLTAWVAGHSGRMIRIARGAEFYGFTYVSETDATLDREYEGESAAGAEYRLNKNVYTLPGDVRQVLGVEGLAFGGPLQRISLLDLNALDPQRSVYGSPRYYCWYMDSISDPPALQIELYPVPVKVEGYRYTATVDPARPGQASVSLLPWVRPAALLHGVQAEIALYRKDISAADFHERQFNSLVLDMVSIASRRRGATALKPAEWMVRHQARRYAR